MQLRIARLCLDCEEVHDLGQCPVCASETFTFLTRWVPTEERRRPPRSQGPEVEVYRRLTSGEVAPPKGGRLLKNGLVGLAALGVVGLIWGRPEQKKTGGVG